MSSSAGPDAGTGMTFDFETQWPNKEAYCKRTTFYVNANWQLGATLEEAKSVVGQMYVESLEPRIKTQKYPVVLIHGDFHTGQIWLTKPDDNPGWASYFLTRGYHVYTLDLPPCGRSNFLTANHFRYCDIAYQYHSMDASFVERELTAPEKQPLAGHKAAWPRVHLHDKWPGTGERGDAIFTRYCASLETLTLRKPERETLAQNALCELLKVTGKAILVGEGSGGTMAWLAADAAPDLVVGIVAVEPAGPPCGVAFTRQATGRSYTSSIKYDPSCRRYGMADIPLTYDPPLDRIDLEADRPVLDVHEVTRADGNGRCILQRPIEIIDDMAVGGEKKVLRQLKHLKRMPHAIVTAEASCHTVYDWATLQFMRQAGVQVDWIRLEESNVHGNGHLMFLETNSDQVASVIDSWIQQKTQNLAASVPAPASSSNTLVPVANKKAIKAPNRRASMKGQGVVAAMPQKQAESMPLTQRDDTNRDRDGEQTETKEEKGVIDPGQGSIKVEKQHPSEHVASGYAPGQTAAQTAAPSHKRANPEAFAKQVHGESEKPPRKYARKRQQPKQSMAEAGPYYQTSSFPPNIPHSGNSMMNMAQQNPFPNQHAPPLTNMGSEGYVGLSTPYMGMMPESYEPNQWSCHHKEQILHRCACPNAAAEMNHVCGRQMGYGGPGAGDFPSPPSGTLRFGSPMNNEATGQFPRYCQDGQGMAQPALCPAPWANSFNSFDMGPTQTGHGYNVAPSEVQAQNGDMQAMQGQQQWEGIPTKLAQPTYHQGYHQGPNNEAQYSMPQLQLQGLQGLYPSPTSLEQSGGSDKSLLTRPSMVMRSPLLAPGGDPNQAQIHADFVNGA